MITGGGKIIGNGGSFNGERPMLMRFVNCQNICFDFDDCKDVFINGCTIETGDDSICLKSSSGGICENIIISNCNLSSRTAVFKTGTASKGGFRNVVVTNCIFHDCGMELLTAKIMLGRQTYG